jgi:predicted PurR-regulated permease PerM
MLAFLIIAGFGSLLISESSRFSDSGPLLVIKFNELLHQTITDLSGYLNLYPQKILDWILKSQDELVNTSNVSIEKTILIIGNGLIVLLLLPIYIFLLLYYKPVIIEFIYRLYGADNKRKVTEIISQTKTVVQRYLYGRFIEVLIIGTLYTGTLLILGIEYALVLGIIGALVNVIPYIGGIVGVALPVMVALVTKPTPLYAVYIFIVYYIIVVIDNHYIVPVIVASKVKINALFSIIVVLAGNALGGIPGMFLSLPLLAIVKVICDNIESLKPWGFLLGGSAPHLFLKVRRFEKTEDNSSILESE